MQKNMQKKARQQMKNNQLKKLKAEIKWRKKALAHLKEWKKQNNHSIEAYTNSLGNELSDYKKTLKILKKMRHSEDSAPSEEVENIFAGCQAVIDKAMPIASVPKETENKLLKITTEALIKQHAEQRCENCIHWGDRTAASDCYKIRHYAQCKYDNYSIKDKIVTMKDMSCPRFEIKEVEDE